MKLLKKYPFFLILLVVFFCLHGWVENYNSLSVEEVFFVGLSVFIFILSLFLILFLIIHKMLLAGLITLFISIWYFFFGALHDFIQNTTLLTFLKSYTVLLPVLFGITILCFFLLKSKPNLWSKIAFYLNILLIIYCVIDFYGICIKSNESLTHINKKSLANIISITKPDIFFILLDGYPGDKSLKDSFHFNNDIFNHFMEENQFVSLPISSNYDLTVFSMSSILNMDYIKTSWNSPNINQKDVQKRTAEIKEAEVFDIFVRLGYEIDNNSIFDIKSTSGLTDENSFLLGHSILLTDKILINRINRDLGTSLPVWVSRFLPFINDQTFYSHRKDNERVKKHISKIGLQKNRKYPLFSYSHLISPHGPYYFDSVGKEMPMEQINGENAWNNKGDFLSYLKYTNRFVKTLITSLRINNPNAVILLKSDHGFRNYLDGNVYHQFRFNNIAWVYFPNKNYGDTLTLLSDVNFFRYFFNNQFNFKSTFLKDTFIHVK